MAAPGRGGEEGRHGPGGAVVLPLVVHFDRVPGGGCASALGSSCQVMPAPDDSVWDCAK